MREFAGGDYPDEEEGIPEHVFVNRLRTACTADAEEKTEDEFLAHLSKYHSPRFVRWFEVHGFAVPETAAARVAMLGVLSAPVQAPSVTQPGAVAETTRLTLCLRGFRWLLPKNMRGDVDLAIHDLGADVREFRAKGAHPRVVLAFAAWQSVLTMAALMLEALHRIGRKLEPWTGWRRT
jgi:hypothetical protein